MTKPGQKKRYPMPCPGCSKIIDARDHLCPHCGIDTDAKLRPLRLALPFILIAAVVGFRALSDVTPGPLAVGLIAATAAMLVVKLRPR